MDEKRYMVFPIAMLQSPGVTKETRCQRVAGIVRHVLEEMADYLLARFEQETAWTEPVRAQLARVANDRGLSCDEDDDDLERVAWYAAVEQFGFQFAPQASDVIPNVNRDVGKKLSRVRVDIMAEARHGTMSWRDFSVLVAVMAVCFPQGKAKAHRASNAQLAAMAAGYGSQKYADPSRMLAVHQVRHTLNKLQARKWFARVAVGRGQWFSTVMPQADLESWVAVNRAKRQVSSEIRQQNQAGVRQRVLAKQAVIAEKLRRQNSGG